MKQRMTRKEAELRQQMAMLKAEIALRNADPLFQTWLRTEATPAQLAEFERKNQLIKEQQDRLQQHDDFTEAQARLVVGEHQFSQELH